MNQSEVHLKMLQKNNKVSGFNELACGQGVGCVIERPGGLRGSVRLVPYFRCLKDWRHQETPHGILDKGGSKQLDRYQDAPKCDETPFGECWKQV